MITCPACAKQNQDHYRFCLGCGAELPRGAAVPEADEPEELIEDEETQIGGIVAAEAEKLVADATAAAADAEDAAASAADEPAGAPAEPSPAEPPPTADPEPDDAAAAEPAAAADVPPGTCPECDHVNPLKNRFCASCGFRLDAEGDAPVVPAPRPSAEGGVAVLIALDPEGNQVGRFEMEPGEVIIGRDTGGIFETDSFLSPRHARFVVGNKSLVVNDLNSLNGVFRKLLAEQSEPLEPGQRFRIGQELMQYDELGGIDADEHGVEVQGAPDEDAVACVSLVVGRGTLQPSHPIYERGIHLGRERGDVLFPEDGYVSGLHCHIGFDDGQAYVTDLGSSNGTFVQVTGEAELRNGDVLLMGQQLFRVAL